MSIIRRCTWTGARMNLYSAPRRSLLRRTRHDDSPGEPSDSFLGAVAALHPVMCGASYRPFRVRTIRPWDRNRCRGVLPNRRPQTPRFGEGHARGNSGWVKAPWLRSRRSGIVEP
jgi:hypothetical protein